ncbi:DUF6070 family protein [Candidatus Ventrimonas sp. KK005]
MVAFRSTDRRPVERSIWKEVNREQSEKVWEPVAEISDSSVVMNDTGAAVQVQEVYRDAAIEEIPPYTYTVRNFSGEQRNWVVSMLGTAGYISVTDGANMKNHESVRDFYSAYLKEQDTMVTIFDVNLDGVIGAAYTFIHRRGKRQTFYVQIGWRGEGILEVISTAVSDIAEIRLTEKGYSYRIPN